MTDAPMRPEDVTADWLGSSTGSKVTGFSMEQIGIGVGLLGRLYRVTLEGGDVGSAIAKFPTLDEGARANVAHPLNFYEKEVRFYREAADDVPIPTPKVYAAEYDASSGDFVLLLEDLGSRRMEDQITGCGTGDAETAIDTLIDLHTSWWGREFPSWIPAYSDPPYPQVIAGMYGQAWPKAQELFAGHFPSEIIDFGNRYVELVPWFMDELGKEPYTLVHGDFRLDNLFFAAAAGDPPLTIVDWQICFKGRPGYDVAYFVSQSLTSDARRGCEDALKRRYLDGLAAKGADYAPDMFEHDYRRTVAYCFIYAVVTAGQIELTNDRMRDLILGIGDRAVQAIQDTKALDVLP